MNLQDLPLHIPSILPTSSSRRYLQLETEATSQDASSPYDLLNFDIKLSNEVMHITRETLSLPMAVQMLVTSCLALYFCIYAVVVPVSFVVNGFRTQFGVQLNKIKNSLYNVETADRQQAEDVRQASQKLKNKIKDLTFAERAYLMLK